MKSDSLENRSSVFVYFPFGPLYPRLLCAGQMQLKEGFHHFTRTRSIRSLTKWPAFEKLTVWKDAAARKRVSKVRIWETAVTVPGILEPAGLACSPGSSVSQRFWKVYRQQPHNTQSHFFYSSLFLFLFTLCSHSYFLVFLFSLGLMSVTYCHISKNVPCLDCNISSEKRLVACTTKKVCGWAQL